MNGLHETQFGSLSTVLSFTASGLFSRSFQQLGPRRQTGTRLEAAAAFTSQRCTCVGGLGGKGT